ncbi:hypothetical protein ACVQ92_13100 [Staphylococcus aureus]
MLKLEKIFMKTMREVVNKQIEIIKNANADASAKKLHVRILGRYFDRQFADDLDKHKQM